MENKNLQKTIKNNNVEILLSNTYLASFYAVLDKIAIMSKQDKFANIILVVPDKFSLNAEQLMFDRLKTTSVFNVWLTTQSRLIAKVMEDQKDLKLLSKNSGTMLVSEIIQNNIDKISTYKKIASNYSFAETMFNVINLLKSSGITPDELKQNFDETNFGLKIQDIYLIYNEYEKSLETNIDSITRLQIFDRLAVQSDYIKNSQIFFAMFDSFTNAQLSSIVTLAKSAKSFCIGMCANTLQSNSLIYDNVTFSRLTSKFQDSFVHYDVKNIASNFSPIQNFMIQNLFSVKPNQQMETDRINMVECENTEKEIFYTASKIKYLILEKHYKFDQINIAVCGLEDYQLLITKFFDQFDLPYYIDSARTMLDSNFVKTLIGIFDFIVHNSLTSDAISIAKSPLFNVSSEDLEIFENYCYKYNISGNDFFSSFEYGDSDNKTICENVRKTVFLPIKNFAESICDVKKCGEYVQALNNFLQKLDAENVLNADAEKKQDVVEQKIETQVYQKLQDLLTETTNLLCNEQMTKEMFFEMLKSGLASINLLTVPLKCDSIFIGDASQSTYYPRKILFVLGATSTRMPSYQLDFGTITDSEIKSFKSKEQITPSIKELNKREKFKLFCLLSSASDGLDICYSDLTAGEVSKPSEFMLELSKIFTCNAKPLAIETYGMETIKPKDTLSTLPAYYVGTTLNAINIAKGRIDALKTFLQPNLDEIIKKCEQNYLDDLNKFSINDARHILFNNAKISVTQVEKYFSCPFKQFIDSGVKPRENDKFEVKSLDVGNILHKTAELYVDYCIENNFETADTDALAKKAFEKAIFGIDNKYLKTNKHALKSLEQEALRFCNAIQNQINSSDFKPKFAEYKFNNFKLENGIYMDGKADRLDFDDSINAFRVIDYKTGKDKFDFKSAYYGIKLQLFVYLKVLQDLLNKKGIETAYMPVRNNYKSFGDSDFKNYKLDGVTLFDEGIIAKLDKNLVNNNESDIIDVKYNKAHDSIDSRKQSNLLSSKQFVDIENYCIKILNGAITEMLDGYISPKPYLENEFENSCAFCKYKGICHYQIMEQGYRTLSKKTKTDFCEGENE